MPIIHIGARKEMDSSTKTLCRFSRKDTGRQEPLVSTLLTRESRDFDLVRATMEEMETVLFPAL